ncbi:MAG: ABC transporter permease [Bryobacteraceae bacterium]
MDWLTTLRLRLRSLLFRKQLDRDLDDEMRFHLEMMRAAGGDVRRFGNATRWKETSRNLFTFAWLESLLQDLQYAVRTMRRSPGFTFVAVMSLALGIGANTAIFSLFDAVLLKTLPVQSPERLVIVKQTVKGHKSPWSYPLYQDIARSQQVFSGMLVSTHPDVGSLEAGKLHACLASGNYFEVLGVNAMAGRAFSNSDESSPVAVISFGFWERQYGRDPAAVGKKLVIDGSPVEIIGVTPREFFGEEPGEAPDIWLPIWMQPQINTANMLNSRGWGWLEMMGRLKPGISESQALAALNVDLNHALLETERPAAYRVELEPGARGLASLRDRFSKPLRVLMTVVFLVLLIACSNVANLLLARATVRRKEIGVRLALGAGRGRVVRQLLTESILLAAMGAILGLFLANLGGSILLQLVSTSDSPVTIALQPDARILLFTSVTALLTGILFGLAPALQATKTEVQPALVRDRPRQRLSKSLIIAQVALSLILLTSAGLLVRSLQNLKGADAGFRRDRVFSVSIRVNQRDRTPAAWTALHDRVYWQLNAIPGVLSASLDLCGLLTECARTSGIRVPGRIAEAGHEEQVRVLQVSPNYFQTVGMQIAAGRGFEAGDRQGAPGVVVVNQTLARYYFPGQEAVGKRLFLGEAVNPVEVVGVVKDAKLDGMRDDAPRLLFQSYVQIPGHFYSAEVRTAPEAAGVVSAARKVIEADRTLEVRGIRTLTEQLEETLVPERMMAKLASFFGALALLLAAVGLYGTMSYAVARRTNEIGIRMAVGAGRGDVVWMVLREVALLATIGLALGVPAALAAGRMLQSYLFGLNPGDPLTLLVAAAVLSSVVAIAGFLPARRAAAIDPMTALRME